MSYCQTCQRSFDPAQSHCPQCGRTVAAAQATGYVSPWAMAQSMATPAETTPPAAVVPVADRAGSALQYQIYGDDMQLVEIILNPGETVIAEAGTMNYMESGITFATRLGDGSVPNNSIWGDLLSAGKRLLSGESLFVTHFSNAAAIPQRVAFAAPIPGGIIPIDLAQMGGSLLCQKEAFL